MSSATVLQLVCKQCGVVFHQNKYTNIPSTYCSRSCANAGRSRRKKTLEERTTATRVWCLSRHLKCKYCNTDTIGTRICTECKRYSKQIKTLTHFGFNSTVVGTSQFIPEVLRVQQHMKQEYISGKSIHQLCKEYRYFQTYALAKFYRTYLNVNVRGRSEAARLMRSRGDKPQPINTRSKYRHGWHTTYTGRKAYYRSSYELEYFKWLDDQQIDYQSEPFSLPYFDSQRNIERTAIPDVFIPATNTLIEIKSTWTYDEQQMKDRFSAFRKAGYNTKLILNKQEVLI